MTASMDENILEVKHMTITLYEGGTSYKMVNRISFTVGKGEIVGIVGESGCGKSMTALALQDLLKNHIKVTDGSMIFDGKDLRTISAAERREINGNDISVIFQEPMTSLNPLQRIGTQVAEPFMIHQGMNKKQANERVIDMLNDVRIPNPEVVAKQYPHQLSGGMRQRVMIAMALACKPRILIADEPSTALDVTIQAQILKLMNDLQEETGTAILFITHDLGVICQMADDVAVLYCGQVVEMAPARTIFGGGQYQHPYTEGLLVSVPRLDTPVDERLEAIPGAVPHPLNLPVGCKFAPRCKYAQPRCHVEEPELLNVTENQQVRCFYPDKEARQDGKFE